jgi:hypothetical protein
MLIDKILRNAFNNMCADIDININININVFLFNLH